MRPLSRPLKPPKLGGWGSERLLMRPLVRVLEPPELGGWGSEQWYTLW